MTEFKILRATKKLLGNSISYNMISPYPTVNFDTEHRCICQQFNIGFMMIKEAMPKFIQDQLSLMLLAALSNVNYYISLQELDDKQNNNDSDENISLFLADRYLQTVAVIVLTAVFLVPEVYRWKHNKKGITWSDFSVLLIFLALTLFSIPPSLTGGSGTIGNGIGTIPFIGMLVLWMSFVIPFYNMYLYIDFLFKVKKSREFVLAYCNEHPFVTTPSFEQLLEDEELFQKLIYATDERKKKQESFVLY